MNNSTVLTLVAFLVFAGCATEEASSGSRSGTRPGAGEESKDGVTNGEGAPPGTVACTKTGRSYPNFDGSTLEGNRPAGMNGGDRDRIKPYGALKSELARVLGSPVNLTKGAFGEEPANADSYEKHYTDNDGKPSDVSTWYTEPASGALELYSVVQTSFDACTKYVAAHPAADCAGMARAFWSRVPTPVEIDACTAASKNGLAWGCTSLVASANFLSY